MNNYTAYRFFLFYCTLAVLVLLKCQSSILHYIYFQALGMF